MTTYHDPHTFCWCVCDWLRQCGQKIHLRQYRLFNQHAAVVLRAEDIAIEGADLRRVFIDFCAAVAKQAKLPVAYDPAPDPKKYPRKETQEHESWEDLMHTWHSSFGFKMFNTDYSKHGH